MLKDPPFFSFPKLGKLYNNIMATLDQVHGPNSQFEANCILELESF